MRLISFGIQRCFGTAAVATTTLYRWFVNVMQAFQDACFVLHTAGKLRRFWLVHFRKEYVHGQLLAREGDCRQCGMCCNLLFTCPMLTKKRRCLVYGSCRPQACKVFPIDQGDIDEVNLCGGHCGYRFHTEDCRKIR